MKAQESLNTNYSNGRVILKNVYVGGSRAPDQRFREDLEAPSLLKFKACLEKTPSNLI